MTSGDTSDSRQTLRAAVADLRAAGVEDPAGDARRLLEYALGIAAGQLSLRLPDRLDPAQVAAYAALIAGRASRRPVAQLTGTRSFYGRDFIVTADTLDPRPDTETLIAAALAAPFTRVLDLGTGTGCILLTLLAERPAASGLGVDLSEPALAVAAGNARALDLADRAAFRRSDWFADVVGAFDLITANPPYIALAEMPGLAPEVRDHEPAMALTDGGDGLGAYRAILAAAPRHLVPGGRLIVEIGWRQGPAVAALFAAAGLEGVAIGADMSGHDRIVAGISPQPAAICGVSVA